MLIDLKDAEAVASVLDLLESADVLVEASAQASWNDLAWVPGPSCSATRAWSTRA